MTVKIVLEFPDLISADAMLHRLAARGSESAAPDAALAPAVPSIVVEAGVDAGAAPQSVPAKPKRRGRKSNAEKAAEAQALQASEEIAEQTERAAPPAPRDDRSVSFYTAEDVHKALQKVFEATGIPGAPEDRCFAILARNGATRISEIKAKPETWTQFMADCDAALKGKDFTKVVA